MTYDLGLEGGTIVRGSGRCQGNLYIKDGVVAAVAGERLEAREHRDCAGLFILPGMIDGHVLFQDRAIPAARILLRALARRRLVASQP